MAEASRWSGQSIPPDGLVLRRLWHLKINSFSVPELSHRLGTGRNRTKLYQGLGLGVIETELRRLFLLPMRWHRCIFSLVLQIERSCVIIPGCSRSVLGESRRDVVMPKEESESTYKEAVGAPLPGKDVSIESTCKESIAAPTSNQYGQDCNRRWLRPYVVSQTYPRYPTMDNRLTVFPEVAREILDVLLATKKHEIVLLTRSASTPLSENNTQGSNGLTLFRRTAGMQPSPARRGPRSSTITRSSLPLLSRVSTRCCRSSWPIWIPAPLPRRPWWTRLSRRASSDSRRASGQGN